MCSSHNSEIFHRWQSPFNVTARNVCQNTQLIDGSGWMSVLGGRDHCSYGRGWKCLWSAWNWLEASAYGLAWRSLSSCLQRTRWDELWACFGKEPLRPHHDGYLWLSGLNMLTSCCTLGQVGVCTGPDFSKSSKLKVIFKHFILLLNLFQHNYLIILKWVLPQFSQWNEKQCSVLLKWNW